MGQVLYYFGSGHNDDRLQLLPHERVTLTLAYLISDVKNAYGGTKPDAEAMLYVTVGGACLF